ncbi:alcohol dehydrogenase catalytic domain-containing protein [Fulvimonas yonginensis]|uniref:Alcohol dehydrogenase catalytic domain-containing protein n=1 Tax=Fulvimonas yonginensis TaxID=1495200 RepID=A0ABU8JEH9_9GAMM
MVLETVGQPLVPRDLPTPVPGPGEVRLRVEACGVCRTDLHVIDGELPGVHPPVVPGHEVVGVVDALGPDMAEPAPGQRLGVPWLGSACGVCDYCRSGRENLCDAPQFTGYTRPAVSPAIWSHARRSAFRSARWIRWRRRRCCAPA